MSIIATLALLISPSSTALADNVVADDQIVQGGLCVGATCADGEPFPSGADIKIKGSGPHISRALKQDVRPLEAGAAVDALAGLEPVTFSYAVTPGDPRVGFIAEDVPELVATPGRRTLSALEIVAVLTRVVKEQQQAIAELTARLAAVEARP